MPKLVALLLCIVHCNQDRWHTALQQFLDRVHTSSKGQSPEELKQFRQLSV